MINIFYPDNLIEILDKSRFNYIPKIIEKDSELLCYRKYYSSDFIQDSYFKVTDTFMVDGYKYAELSFSDTTFWMIPATSGNYNIYELLMDNIGILDEKDIVNNKRAYYGYEIKYWFFKNYRHKYVEFKPFVEDTSITSINDNTKYFLNGEFVNNRYINARVTIMKKK